MDSTKFANWRKSSRSGGGDNCVEVACASDGTVGIRDSKNPTGAVLEFVPANWKTFINEVREGAFDR
jgi:hypothetical protein